MTRDSLYKKRIARGLTAFLLLMIIMLLFSCGKHSFSCDEEINDIVSYLREKGELKHTDTILLDSSYFKTGDSLSDWLAIMLGRAEIEDGYEGYLSKLKTEVETRYKSPEKLSQVKATEWHRISLAIMASGGDPTNFGKDPDGNPIDLIADGVYNWNQTDNIGTQGSNAVIFALLTLDARAYQVPENSIYTREKLLGMLLNYQDGDWGGFGLSQNGSADVDTTAMALQALAPYYAREDEKTKEYMLEDGKSVTVEEAVDRGLMFLSEAQANNGMYRSGDIYTSESCSQVIIALCSLGIDPMEDERFIKTGRSVVDGLLEFKMADGSYAHTLHDMDVENGDNVLSSQSAGCAFTALKLLQEKRGRYYDFREGDRE